MASNRPPSLFYQRMQRMRKLRESQADITTDINVPEKKHTSSTSSLIHEKKKEEKCSSVFGERSYVITDSEADAIHKENLYFLSKFSPEEIEAKRNELLNTLEPGNIEFLRKKRNSSAIDDDLSKSFKRISTKENKNSVCVDNGDQINNGIEPMDESNEYSEEMKTENTREDLKEETMHIDLDQRWIHMDKVERYKLKWMEDVPSITKPLPNTLYNARFDFEGDLLPYVEENVSTCDRGLYHHGDEPQRPGYAIEELYQLTRSTVPKQRIFALNTLAAILEKEFILATCLETELLKQLLDSGIFLILRFSLDERLKPVYLAALRAMTALLWRPVDMHFLSDMVGLYGDVKLPSFYVNNENLTKENLSEIKDIDLINVDVIRGCLRTNMIHRFRFFLDDPILEVNHSLQIIKCLTRISYHSMEATDAIMACPTLIEALFLNSRFHEEVSSDKLKMYTAKLLLLFRVICSCSCDHALALIRRLKLLPFLLSTISDPVTRTTTTSVCIQLWNTLLCYKLKDAVESISSLISTLGSLLNQLSAIQIDNLDNGMILLANSIMSLLIFIFKHAPDDAQLLLPVVERLCCQWINVVINEKDVSREFIKLVANSIFLLTLSDYSHVGSSDLSSFRSLMKLFFRENDSIDRLLSKDELTKCSFLKNAVKHNFVPSLPSLNIPPSIINSKNMLALVHSIVRYLKINSLKEPRIVDTIWSNYVKPVLLTATVSEVANHWSAKFEIQFLSEFLMLNAQMIRANCWRIDEGGDGFENYQLQEKARRTLKLAFFILPIIHIDEVILVWNILDAVVFDKCLHRLANFVVNSDGGEYLLKVRRVFLARLQLPVQSTVISSLMSTKTGTEYVLPIDWLYVPILEISNRFADTGESQSNVNAANVAAHDIRSILRWIQLVEYMVQSEGIILQMSPSTRFCRVCCVFFCGDIFLELSDELRQVLDEMMKIPGDALEFKSPIVGIPSFYDFYTELCEVYSSSSYGDTTFSAYIMVPLQQKYNVRIRLYLWREQSSVLRFFKIKPEQLPVPLSCYLEPCELNTELLETYLNFIATGNINERISPVFYRIALHHVAIFIKLYSEENVAQIFKKFVLNIRNEEIKNRILNYTYNMIVPIGN